MTQPPYHEYPPPSPGDYNPHNRPDPYQVDDVAAPPPSGEQQLPSAASRAEDGPPSRPQRPIYRPDRSDGHHSAPPAGQPPIDPTGAMPVQHPTGALPQPPLHTGALPAPPGHPDGYQAHYGAPSVPTHQTGPLPSAHDVAVSVPTHHTGPLPSVPTHQTGPLPPVEDAPLVDPRIGYAPFPMPPAAAPPKRWKAGLLGGVSALVVITLVVWLIAVSGGGDPEPGPVVDPNALDSNAEITVNSYPPNGLLPGDALDEVSVTAVQPLYATLTRTDPASGLPAGWLAESVTSEDDARTWTIALRSGWKFHNGEEVTAQSVADSWNLVAAGSRDFAAAPLFRSIKGFEDAQSSDARLSGVEVVDDVTLTVELTRSWASFPASLMFPAFSPIAPECAARLDACSVQPIGTGPFRLVDPWSEGGPSLSYQRWDAYPLDAPAYASVSFRFYTDSSALARNFIGGAGDLARIPADQVDEVSDHLVSSLTGHFGYIGVPHSRDGYDDAVFRRALSLAIDRPGILAASGYAHQRSAQGFTASGYPGSAADSACAECVYAPDRASALFKQSDWPADKSFVVSFAREDPESAAMAPSICDAVRSAFNIDCEMTAVPYRELRAAISNGSIDGAWIAAWLPETGTAEAYLGPLYGSGNQLGFHNEQFDATLAVANRQADLADALPMYAEAEAILAAYMPVVPLTTGVYHLAHRDRVVPESLYVDPTTQAPQFDLVEVRFSAENG